MKQTGAIIITTINGSTPGVRKIAQLCSGWDIIMVGDNKTPAGWNCAGIRFLSVKDQAQLGSRFAAQCPLDHYARKNIGYEQLVTSGLIPSAELRLGNLWLDEVTLAQTLQPHGG
jgi:hypothetical protein